LNYSSALNSADSSIFGNDGSSNSFSLNLFNILEGSSNEKRFEFLDLEL
jgi:hypothetical protein